MDSVGSVGSMGSLVPWVPLVPWVLGNNKEQRKVFLSVSDFASLTKTTIFSYAAISNVFLISQ